MAEGRKWLVRMIVTADDWMSAQDVAAGLPSHFEGVGPIDFVGDGEIEVVPYGRPGTTEEGDKDG